MKIIFTSEDMDQIMIEDDAGVSVVAYPPVSEEDKKIVEDFGGDDAIRKASVDFLRAEEKMQERWEAFQKKEAIAKEAFSIEALINTELDKEKLMTLKLSIFSHDCVKNSKNREILIALRKSDDPIDLVMYFGMLRNAAADVS